MKVTETKPVAAVDRVSTQETSSSTPAANPAAPTDRVTVSESRDVRIAVGAARKAANVDRTERLKDIEAQVRSGGYRPDPSRVAQQILAAAEVDAQLQAMLK